MRKIIFLLIGFIGMMGQSRATVFTVNVNDGGWGNPATLGTLAKAIADFNGAGAGSHTINIMLTLSLNDPAKWQLTNTANLTINGGGFTVDGPGYNSWMINVNQLTINNWTMTAGFGTATTTLAGVGGHTFNNSKIANVAFIFTKNGNSLVNSSFTGPGGTYTMTFSGGSTLNNINGCFFSQMALTFNAASSNAISNTVFNQSGLSFLAGSNSNTVYGCKFNTNVAGTILVASGIAFDITLNASTGNIIGGNTAAKRNIFAISSTNSVSVAASSDNTKIIGNYFGTDVTGTVSLAGAGTNSTIMLNTSQNVIVDSNIVSSMQGTAGGAIEVLTGNCSGLKIRYNNIGVDVSGAGVISFSNASQGIVFTAGTVNNADIIGNTISRSAAKGIYITAASNPLNIQNNMIGSNSSGLYDGTNYGNGSGGIVLSGAISNTTITNNVIVRNGWVALDNTACGIYIPAPGVATISITNNKIGVYSDNASSAPAGFYSGNAFAGIFFNSTSSGITISNNVIGRNGFGTTKSHGIATAGTITNITISNNYIGVTPASAAIGNGNSGIDLQNVTTGTISGNYISANEGRRTDIPAAGIALSNSSNQISITGNFIGVAPDWSVAGQQLNGSFDGSGIRAEGTANKISINNNSIANNAGNGVNVVAGADFVQIFDNKIYCNAAKGINLNCGGSAPNGPGNSSFGCGTITLNAFVPVPSSVSGGNPVNAVVYVYSTNSCETGTCGINPQGQNRFTAATTTYPTGTTWNYNNGSPMFNDITALAVGTGANCNTASYCRTSEFSNCINNTLPVEFIGVSAEFNKDASATVAWQTASELNNNYFVVMRSEDGVNFVSIGVIQGAGNVSSVSSHTFIDPSPFSGTNYYKIKQVNLDGSAGYSKIVMAKAAEQAPAKVYPNPAFEKIIVEFMNNGFDKTYIMYDLLGKIVKTEILNSDDKHELDISDLPSGSYFIKIITNGTVVVEKFIKRQ
jgi:hypothetical protein